MPPNIPRSRIGTHARRSAHAQDGQDASDERQSRGRRSTRQRPRAGGSHPRAIPEHFAERSRSSIRVLRQHVRSVGSVSSLIVPYHSALAPGRQPHALQSLQSLQSPSCVLDCTRWPGQRLHDPRRPPGPRPTRGRAERKAIQQVGCGVASTGDALATDRQAVRPALAAEDWDRLARRRCRSWTASIRSATRRWRASGRTGSSSWT